jgi:hypothetical protein
MTGQAQFRRIDAGLTSCRWPTAPLPSGWTIGTDANRWWDIEAVTEAAKTLLKNAPAMLSHREGQRWAPQTRNGFEAIKALGDALFVAMPYIEWPFGYYERRTRSKRTKPGH